MDKRQEIIKQAIHLFAEKGYHQTSVHEIAQAVGVSKAAFYNYFETKESLIIEIIQKKYEEMIVKADSHY